MSLLMLAVSCTDPAKEQLRRQVNDSASACPIQIEDGITIDEILYHDDTVEYQATIKADYIDLNLLKQRKREVTTALIDAIENSSDTILKHDIALCREAGAKIKFVISDGKYVLDFEIL